MLTAYPVKSGATSIKNPPGRTVTVSVAEPAQVENAFADAAPIVRGWAFVLAAAIVKIRTSANTMVSPKAFSTDARLLVRAALFVKVTCSWKRLVIWLMLVPLV